MEQNSHRLIREQLMRQLQGGQAYLVIEDLLDEISFEDLGKRPAGLPYSFYEQFFHMRVAQFDILDYSQNLDYEKQDWPDDYWPVEQAPKDEAAWEELKESFFKERDEMMDVILDEHNGLTAPVVNHVTHTYLREAMLVLEHNAYHTGQLALIFRLLSNDEE